MAKIAASTLIERPADVIWRFVTDFSRAPEYDPNIISVKQTSEGPLAVGTDFELTDKKVGKAMFRTIEYDPDRKLTWVVTSPRAFEGSKHGIILEDVGGKAKLTITWDLKLGGLYWLLGPYLALGMKKSTGAEVNGIKRILETGAPF